MVFFYSTIKNLSNKYPQESVVCDCLSFYNLHTVIWISIQCLRTLYKLQTTKARNIHHWYELQPDSTLALSWSADHLGTYIAAHKTNPPAKVIGTSLCLTGFLYITRYLFFQDCHSGTVDSHFKQYKSLPEQQSTTLNLLVCLKKKKKA
jgi:hypothetical protein